MHYLTILLLFLGLFASPALAQEPPVADEATTEEAAPADVVPGDELAGEAVTEEAAPKEGVAGEEAAPEEAAPEEGVAGEEATDEAGTDEAGTDEAGTEAVVGDPTDEIVDIEEAVEDAFALIKAIQSKNWPLAVGLILMLLVFVANKLGLKKIVGPKALPWVAMSLAVLATVGTGLIAGLGWADSIMQGILAGVVAIGGWELLLKHFLGDKKPAPEETKAA